MSELYRKAYLGGGTLRTFADGQTAFTALSWEVSGNCQRPKHVELLGRPELKRGKTIVSTEKANATHRLELSVRCRQCENCLKARGSHWRHRALAEYRASARTWLVTLTFRPDVHQHALDVCRVWSKRRGVEFDGLPTAAQFGLRHRALTSGLLFRGEREPRGAHVTRFLKRLRKMGPDFRYLLVCEEHKSGLPHYHLLVHEVIGGSPVRHSMLKRQWDAGFLDAALVKDDKQAVYACKYLTKSQAARVRASLGYGDPMTALAQASLPKAQRETPKSVITERKDV